MKLDVALTLNLEVEVDDEMVDRLSVDGYDIALMIAEMYGDELMMETKRDDDSYRNRITVESWHIG